MRRRVILATAPLVCLLWAGIGAILLQKHRMALQSAEQQTRNLSQAFDENIIRTIEAIDITVRSIRTARAIDPAHFDLVHWLQRTGLPGDLTLQVSFTNKLGGMLASNLGTVDPAVSIADREHFKTTRDRPDDGLFISVPVLGRVSGRWSVQFVRKLLDDAGGFDGAIIASLDPAFLSRFYATLTVGRGAILLLGEDGVVRAAAPEGAMPLSSSLAGTAMMPPDPSITSGTVDDVLLRDGVPRLFSWRRLPQYGLIVAVGASSEDAMAEYRQDLHGWLLVGSVLTVVTIIVGVMLARHRAALVSSRAILEAAVENISQGLLVIDGGRSVPVINARAVELLELPPELAHPGISFDVLLDYQTRAGEFEGPGAGPVRAVVEAGGITAGDTVYHRTRGNGRTLEIRTRSSPSGLAVRTFTDITDQQRTAHVLAEARDAAEAAARTRSEFLATMSHEIRTPLNGVIGVAGLLEDMELGPVQRSYVELIRESGDHLLQLINDILDFSRLEASRLELESVRFSPRALVSAAADLFRAQASVKGIEVSSTVASDVPDAVMGDPGRLRQILLNLVGNAIKFTDSGSVRIHLAQSRDDDTSVRLAFEVVDTGIGIDPEALGHIFEDFTQLDGSISRRFGGSGLGLAISRRLAGLQGGTIGVDSVLGRGSTFRFDVLCRLPGAGETETGAMPAAAVAQQRALHVLLAEDNATNRRVAGGLLERLGHQVTMAVDGAEAVSAVARATFDLVLMDAMMPGMDGLAATRTIRAAERPGARLPIVGLTAGSRPEDLDACLNAGMDGVSTKPITLDRLRAAIEAGLSKAAAAMPPAPVRSRLAELEDELGPEIVREIVDAFEEDASGHLARLREAAGAADMLLVRRESHSIVGAARNVGARSLGDLASRLENEAGQWSGAAILAGIAAMETELDAWMSDLRRRDRPLPHVAAAGSI